MVLTVKQVAERLQLPTAHVREMILEGALPGFKRSKRLWGVLLADLEKWLASRSSLQEAGKWLPTGRADQHDRP